MAESREEATGVLLGYDTELTYEKLEDCCILLGQDVPYVATHPDLVCPTWFGSAPDCGSIMEMLRTCGGHRDLHRYRLRRERGHRHHLRPLRRGDAGGY